MSNQSTLPPKTPKSHNSGVLAWFASNSVAANLLMVLILCAGVWSAFTIKKRTFPEFEINSISISVAYPGASPVDVEQGITIKVEEAVSSIAGIEKTSSTAREGISTTTLQMTSGFDIEKVLDKVEIAINAIRGLPVNSERPQVVRNEFVSNVLWLSIFGENIDDFQLADVAKQVQDELRALPEINQVVIVGNSERIMAIEVSENRLREYQLSFNELAQIIRNSSIEVAAGRLETRDGNIAIQARGQAMTAQEFADITVRANTDGSLLKLGDIAHIEETFNDQNSLFRFNQQRAISLRVDSVENSDDLAISAAVEKWLIEKRETLPDNISIADWGNTAFYLQGRLDMMLENVAFGALLVFIVLALFLRLSVAFWVMLGIPISFLGAIWLMPIGPLPIDITIVSLFAFILVLGIVVDDAIVIGESIYDEVTHKGHSLANVISGLKRVVVPATFGVLTTIATFAPLLIVGGPAASFIESISVVVILCLIFSLIESKLILPAHLVNTRLKPFNRSAPGTIERIQLAFSDFLSSVIQNVYEPLLERCIRWRYLTLVSFITTLGFTIFMLVSGTPRLVLFPDVPSDFIETRLVLETGISPQERNKALLAVEDAILGVEESYIAEQIKISTLAENDTELQGLVKHTLVYSETDYTGGVVVEMTKAETRAIDAYEIAKRWRTAVGDIPGLKQLDITASTNAGGSKPVNIQLQSNHLSQLEAAAKELQAAFEKDDRLYSIENNFDAGAEELRLKLRPEAANLGLTLSDIGRQLRQGFYGDEIQRYQRQKDEIKVLLRYPESERQTQSSLENIRIRTANGTQIPILEVASFESHIGSSTVKRENGKRSITLLANVYTDKASPNEVINALKAGVLADILQRYPNVTQALGGASSEQEKMQQNFFIATLLSVLLVYALLAIPLKSYLQPLIVLSVIPFGLVGAVGGHLLLGLNMSMFSIAGIIALAGVLVNDSLILVDFVNRSRATGLNLNLAIRQAGKKRFRAIILTSLTTFLGLAPILFERSLQAQFVIPMAVSLGFGILFGTFITLLLIPTIYAIAVDIRRFFSFSRDNDSTPSTPPPTNKTTLKETSDY